jgi:flagellar basal-body rod protein FlgG
MSLAVELVGLSMASDIYKLNVASNNLANVQTDGYKRDIAVISGFDQHLIDSFANIPGASVNQQISPEPQSVIDTTPGVLKFTDNPLDVSIDGVGYFQVSTPNGPAYTRHGSFTLDALGRLVTRAGYPVLGTSGEIQLSGGQVTIDQNGYVWQGDQWIDQLKVVQFPTEQQPHKIGNGLFASTSSANSSTDTIHVRQGYIESSNVDTAKEMVGLIETVRHFEAAQKVLVGHDEMINTAIRTIGQF